MALTTEVDRFLKHKSETNRFSKMSAESKGSILRMFAESVKNIPSAQVSTYQCKAFYNSVKARVAASTAESYMFTARSFFNWCVVENLCRRNPTLMCNLTELTTRAGPTLPIWSWHNAWSRTLSAMTFVSCCFVVFTSECESWRSSKAVPEWFRRERGWRVRDLSSGRHLDSTRILLALCCRASAIRLTRCLRQDFPGAQYRFAEGGIHGCDHRVFNSLPQFGI
jgi:hypothetical protein